jgi:hypothetical protein
VQTADIGELTKVSDKQSPKHPDDINITVTTYEQRCYNIRSWMKTMKKDVLVKIKGTRDRTGTPHHWKWAAGTSRVGFTNTEGFKETIIK